MARADLIGTSENGLFHHPAMIVPTHPIDYIQTLFFIVRIRLFRIANLKKDHQNLVTKYIFSGNIDKNTSIKI